MTVVGTPADWVDLLDSMVPGILSLVITTWETMQPPSQDSKEDNITNDLCRALRQARAARDLPLQIHTQQIELDTMLDQDRGRLDIAFNVLVPREDIYFCLEAKRLNVVKDGAYRSYASEYVTLGMLRFVSGKYSKTVHHGGMIGYVLDGNVTHAIANIAANIQSQCSALRMDPPGSLLTSAVINDDSRVRETHHHRDHESTVFHIHHLFMAAV